MKRKKLIKTVESNGCVFVRHGGNHDWYKNPQSGKSQPIPRHTESVSAASMRLDDSCDLTSCYPQVFEKIASNLECYMGRLEQDGRGYGGYQE